MSMTTWSRVQEGAAAERKGKGPLIGTVPFNRLATTLMFVAIAAVACMMPAQNDTWWLLRAGQDTWAAGRVQLTDTYSHTALGAAWPNHEWLSQLLFYGIYRVGGLPLLTLTCATVVTCAWAIVWRETPGPARFKVLLTAFALATATTTWSVRAQVLSLLMVVATTTLLRRRRYVWLPLLFWVWANLHGAVLLGVLLLMAALAAALLEHQIFPASGGHIGSVPRRHRYDAARLALLARHA